MPKIQQHTLIDVTPEKFLNACDSTELHELELLLSTPKYQEKMKEEQGELFNGLPIAGPIPGDILDYYDALNKHDKLNESKSCHQCGCTEEDCSGCIERTGAPCEWVAENLCSACADNSKPSKA